MLQVVIWLAVGVVVGAAAGWLMSAHRNSAVFLNVLVGVAGAVFVAWLVAPLIGLQIPNTRAFVLKAFAYALLGAVVSLASISFVRARATR